MMAKQWLGLFPGHHVSGLYSFPFFHTPHDDLTDKKCSPQSFQRGGGVLGMSEVGGVGLVQNTPPFINVA